MPLFLAPVLNSQIVDANGDPNTGGLVETYLAGSSTPVAVFTTDSGTTPHTNPIVLNSLGWPTLGAVWLTGGVSYKFVIKDAMGVTLRTIDNISGVNDASVSQSEWVVSGFVSTYIDAASFSVPGDQTMVLQINRRLRTTNTSGLIYSTITNSVFSAGVTTVTVANDSGVLDAGLSLIEYALLAPVNSSIPAISVSRFTMATDRVLLRTSPGVGPVEEKTKAELLAWMGGIQAFVPTGAVWQFALASAPTGWIKANGQTIGSAASGATGRANADTEALFTALWNDTTNTSLVIQTSAGAPTTRGASAAADFAANKRMPLPDLRAEFVRGLDDGRGVDSARALASTQAGQMPSHSHGNAGDGINVAAGGQGVKYYGDGPQQTGLTGGTSNGSENRPRNVALLYCIKL